MKNKKKICKILAGIGYWILSLTWGGLLTIPGLFVTLFCIVFLKGKPHKNGFSYIVEVGGDWGGLEFGAVALCGSYYGTDYWEEITAHEFGHSLFPQHLLMGPFYIFLVWIPSACRYWYQNIMRKKYHKEMPAGWYYRFWAEKNASEHGRKVKEWIESD